MAEQKVNPCMIEALGALACGLTPIPIKADGSKTPPFTWKNTKPHTPPPLTSPPGGQPTQNGDSESSAVKPPKTSK